MTPDPITDFDFALPPELIAQEPAERGQSRLMVLPRLDGAVSHTTFAHLIDYLHPGDLLVLNNTRVFPARLLGERVPSGGAVECLLISDRQVRKAGPALPGSQLPTLRTSTFELQTSSIWDCLVHPGQKLKPGARVVFERDGVTLHGEILARHFHGRRTIRLWTDAGIDVAAAVDRVGHMPLPPYIKRDDRPADRDRYQTVYARDRGSIAAPTAGLHFTEDLLEALRSHGVERTEVTLHVGYGTFKPVRAELIDDHEVDPEVFAVSKDAAAALTAARRTGRRIIAVGTTTARALESLTTNEAGEVEPAAREATLFIRPGHTFRFVDGLITNFHLPRSSLLMLVSAFAGRDRVLEAYREAVRERYRFYSYGDAMVIL